MNPVKKRDKSTGARLSVSWVWSSVHFLPLRRCNREECWLDLLDHRLPVWKLLKTVRNAFSTLASQREFGNGREFFHASQSMEVTKWLKVRVRDRVRVRAGAISLQNVVNILSSFVHVVWWLLHVSTMSHVTWVYSNLGEWILSHSEIERRWRFQSQLGHRLPLLARCCHYVVLLTTWLWVDTHQTDRTQVSTTELELIQNSLLPNMAWPKNVNAA